MWMSIDLNYLIFIESLKICIEHDKQYPNYSERLKQFRQCIRKSDTEKVRMKQEEKEEKNVGKKLKIE